ncbi:MAG: hypothetical protein KAI17_14075 [Thiotrichaceae bacterium]|nr:hypothetical protein [Thiotrichaceae bacterium]
MSITTVRKESNHFLKFTWENIFVGFNLAIYLGCLILVLLPVIKVETAIIFFFASSMGLYIFLMFSAAIVNTFVSPVKGKYRPRKTVTGLI